MTEFSVARGCLLEVLQKCMGNKNKGNEYKNCLVIVSNF